MPNETPKKVGTLSDLDIINSRIKILEPLIQTASKHSLEKDAILPIAEKFWEFATKPIVEAERKEQPAEPKQEATPPADAKSAPAKA